MSGTANLSDSRGGGLGIALLRMMLNVLGVNFSAIVFYFHLVHQSNINFVTWTCNFRKYHF